jgi:hypothetical protein
MNRMQSVGDLEMAYRTAFREYSGKLHALQSLMDSGAAEDGRGEAVLLEIEKARVAYNCARDRLAEELAPRGGGRANGSPEIRASQEGRVREAARLLWELAGRPQGTAQRDWSRAEQLVHSAHAAAC